MRPYIGNLLGYTSEELFEFEREYCDKCGKACDAVDANRLRRLDDGQVACTRYICAALDEWV